MTVINMLLLGIFYTTKVKQLNYSLIMNRIWNHFQNGGNNYSAKVKGKTIKASILLLSIFQQISMRSVNRSEEHTSELQSRGHLVCRLLLEKKKNAALQQAGHNPFNR